MLLGVQSVSAIKQNQMQ